MQDIAIAHDQFNTNGGAERVAAEIAREFDCPIYAMQVDEDVPPDDIDIRQVAGSRGEWLMRRHYLLQDAYQMLAWQHVDGLYEYDTIIQTKTNPYWFVPRDDQTVIRYCHSTPRNLYDQFHRRGGHWFTNGMMTVQRMLYQQVIPYADHWVTNSELVAHRVNRYFGIEEGHISTVHPGVDTRRFGSDIAETGEYLFYVGRLARNKRIGLLREIAEAVDRRIVVAGDGVRRDELLDDPPENLEYVGYISEEEKQRRLSEAAATLFFAENEDFGIVPIESFASGTPVIAAEEGFTRYQVQDGQNGYLCEPTVHAAAEAIQRFERSGVEWSPRAIEQYAEQFDIRRFRSAIRDLVDTVRRESTVTPRIELPEQAIADGGTA